MTLAFDQDFTFLLRLLNIKAVNKTNGKIIRKPSIYPEKTINIKKSYLINNYIDNIDNINFKQLIYNAKNIIYNELLNSEEYDNILDYSLKLINNLLIEFNNLNNITDNDLNNINRAKAYITIKCICW